MSLELLNAQIKKNRVPSFWVSRMISFLKLGEIKAPSLEITRPLSLTPLGWAYNLQDSIRAVYCHPFLSYSLQRQYAARF